MKLTAKRFTVVIYDNSTQKQAFVDFLANINVFREEREKTPYTEDNFEKGVVNG